MAGSGPSVSHRPGGTRSSQLKIHIQAGDQGECPCEKGSEAWVGPQERSGASGGEEPLEAAVHPSPT